MKELKFKAWDKVRLEWLPLSSEVWLITHDGKVLINPDECDSRPEDIEIVRYTGLKDKNGKEIYEGDIVKIIDDFDYSIGKIEWNEDEAGFFCCELYEDGTFEEERLYEYAYIIEVVGNIYENPELLEGDKFEQEFNRWRR